MAEPTPTFAGEVQFRRYSDTSTQGAQIVLALPDREALQSFIGLEGKRFMAVLVQIGDDEQPVAGNPVTTNAGIPASGKPRQPLGDLCWRAVQWCKEPEFIDFLNRQEPGIDSEHDASAYIKRVCGVQSRKELDTNPEARILFNARIRGPYHKHLMARGLA